MTKPAGSTVGVNVQLPQRLHKRLRRYAVDNNLTNTDSITAALRTWLSPKR
jgi:hypothetical protein